jgi:hypothetical protein
MTRALRLAAAIVLVMLWAGVAGCGSGQPSVAAACGDARTAAVRLMLENVNATALPRAFDRRVLQARMGRFMAHDSLDARVALVLRSIAKLGGRSRTQAWTDSMTVGKWEACDVEGSRAAVVFVGYETFPPIRATPLTRFTVTMRREHGAWKLVTYDVGWLTSAGPMGDSGKLTIRDLPERVVFRDPPPRNWHYRGPPIPPGAAG